MMKYQQNTIVVKILHTKKRNHLSDFAFQKGIEDEGVKIRGTKSPSRIFAITKSTENRMYNLHQPE
jgi:hypothetical protein